MTRISKRIIRGIGVFRGDFLRRPSYSPLEQIMGRNILWVLAGLLLATSTTLAADGKYSIKSATTAPPKEVSEPVAKLLGQESFQFINDKDEMLAELWIRKEIPAKAGGDPK